VVFLSLQFLYEVTDSNRVAKQIADKLTEKLNLPANFIIDSLDNFDRLFKRGTLTKPLILILDEFDALDSAVIARISCVFRHIYNTRRNQTNKSTAEKDYLLHGWRSLECVPFWGSKMSKVRHSMFNVACIFPI
jgi:hypothetical protein